MKTLYILDQIQFNLLNLENVFIMRNSSLLEFLTMFSTSKEDIIIYLPQNFSDKLLLKFIEDFESNLIVYSSAPVSFPFLSRFNSVHNLISFKKDLSIFSCDITDQINRLKSLL